MTEGDLTRAVPSEYWGRAARIIGVSPEDWRESCRHALSELSGGAWTVNEVYPSTLHLVMKVGGPHGECVVKCFAPPAGLEDDFLALQTIQGTLRPVEVSTDLRAAVFPLVTPGNDLATLVKEGCDNEATRVFCSLLAPAPMADDRFPRHHDIYKSWYEYVPQNNILDHAVQLATAALDDLVSRHESRLVHGDLHHFNILRSEQEWVVIDPQGANLPAVLECGPFLRNPIGLEPLWQSPNQFQERLVIIESETGIDRQTASMCGLVASAEAAVWERSQGRVSPGLEATAALWARIV